MFGETKLKGALIIDPERLEDERGFFARTWFQREFVEHGLNSSLRQCSISFNKKKGTLRGMHYQVHPVAKCKLVRCTRGAIHDVVIDLRRNSPTFLQYLAVVLTAKNHTMLYLPEGFAHSFQTLVGNTEVFYQISEFYSPEHAREVRGNDPVFGIEWPLADPIISTRDLGYPDFNRQVDTL